MLSPLNDGPYKVIAHSPAFFCLAIEEQENNVSVARLKPLLLASGPIKPARHGWPLHLKPQAPPPAACYQHVHQKKDPLPSSPSICLCCGRSAGLNPAVLLLLYPFVMQVHYLYFCVHLYNF